MILLVLLVPPVATQEPFEVSVKDATGEPPSDNATLIFAPLNGTSPLRFETDEDGVAEIDIPAGNYRVRSFVPNETGEQWFEKDMEVNPANGSLSLLRNLPSMSVGRRPELLGAEISSDGSTAYVPIGAPLEIRIAIRYTGDAGSKSIAARATLTKANETLQEGLLGITTLTGPGWINGTLAASTTPAYYANESLTTLRISLFQNGTTTLFDDADPITVFFRDGCLGDAVQLRVNLEGTSVPICATAEQSAAWQTWATEANQLILTHSAWAKRFDANATTWSFAEARAAWDAYAAETAVLRNRVLQRLTTAQTDENAFPTWQQVESLRTVVEKNHTAVEAIWDGFARNHYEETQQHAQISRIQTLGLVLLGALLGSAAAFGGITLIIRAWKRRAEYWIGYSSREQPASPLWLTLAFSGGLALLGLLLTLFSPLWTLLRGGA